MDRHRMQKTVAQLVVVMMLATSGLAMAQSRKERKALKKQKLREEAQASEAIPVSTQVPQLNIPYDPNLPRFVVTVEPLTYGVIGADAPQGSGSASRTTHTTTDAEGRVTTSVTESTTGSNVGNGLAAQLVTSLTHGGNISVALSENVKKDSEGGFTTKMLDGEIGVFVLRGMVTEFTEQAEASGRKRKFSLGRVGAAVAIGGLVSNNKAATITGASLAVANPRYSNEKTKRTGMVGIDIQVIDGRTGRILGSFASKGSFSAVTKAKGMAIFGIGGSNSEFAASALGQATRVCMNDALQKTTDLLVRAPR